MSYVQDLRNLTHSSSSVSSARADGKTPCSTMYHVSSRYMTMCARGVPAGIMTTAHSKPLAAWHVEMVTFCLSMSRGTKCRSKGHMPPCLLRLPGFLSPLTASTPAKSSATACRYRRVSGKSMVSVSRHVPRSLDCWFLVDLVHIPLS